MSAKSPRAAEQAFVRPLQQAVSCISKERLNYSGANNEATISRALILGRSDIGPIPLKGGSGLHFGARVLYRIVPAPEPRRHVVENVGYLYSVRDRHAREILAYHWHPHGHSPIKTPHQHVGAGAGVAYERLTQVHLPTGVISLEQVILLLIDLGAEPLRPDWLQVLRGSGEALF